MKKFFYNITSKNPKSLVAPSLAATVDGFTKIISSVFIFQIIDAIYQHFANPDIPLDTARMWVSCFILVIWLFIQYGTGCIAYDKAFSASYDASANGRIKLAEHLRKLSLGYFSKKNPGELAVMILTDYQTVEQVISHNIPQLISAVVFPVLSFIGLLIIDWKMALAMFVAFPIAVLILLLTTKLQDKLSSDHTKAKLESSNRLQEYLLGMRDIKSYNLDGEKFVTLKDAFYSFMKQSIRIEVSFGPILLVATSFIKVGLTIMIFVGSYLIIDGSLTLPVFLLFLLIGSRVYEPITVFLQNYTEVRYASFSAQRIIDVYDEPELEGYKEVGDDLTINFNNVSFSYKKDTPVLKDVDLSFKPKEITALVGPSGSGKSTITKLITRFFDIDQGTITVGNDNINDINPDSLLDNIAMVFQDVYLFNDTIRNNIKVGLETASDEQIIEAAKEACCHDFISMLPNGYDTMVGEGGATLSGGEKQRISIARALLKDASIVLLDEATASLDPENEKYVQAAIDALIKDKTVIMIAHKLNTIKNAGKIVVLSDGKVCEQGSHDQLLANESIYAKMWNLQQQASDWSIN